MVTRLQVARARACVALRALVGRTSTREIAEVATLGRSKGTDIGIAPLEGSSSRQRAVQELGDEARLHGTLAGVHAHGRDFGPIHQLRRDSAGRQLRPEEEDALIDGKTITRESLERAKAAVNRGELDALQRRSRQPGLVATMSSLEVEDWLEIGSAKRVWMLSVGELFAFVADDELRYATWQFCDDEQRILPHLSRLTPAFDGMHPASILRFMTTPRDGLSLEGEPVSPVDWLLHDGDVRVLVEILDTQLMS